ncbi:permease prefix domain 1-containing protein [Clostridium sp. C8-1-8]|uniref:permease prefix domain 1-containing protein n=1 Tax=Clostridium sp. C8-1-8 TaxID=2698831 RepID=UPI0013692F4C|nr:permease prefix domain 1-containing protein [Clostridium sp. C8-1-8]
MKEIDNYINSIYKNADDDFEEIEEIKNDMRQHLIETVEELKREGKGEAESIKIAIERFGEAPWIKAELSKVIPFTRKNFNIALFVALGMITISFAFIFCIANYVRDEGTIKGVVMILSAPIYIILRAIKLKESIKNKDAVSLKLEWIRLFFVIYIAYLIGSYIQYIQTFSDTSKQINYSINLIPIIGIPNILKGMALKGLGLNIFIRVVLKYFFRYFLLGILAPIAYNSFRKLNNCILLGIAIYIGIFLINSIFSIFGLSYHREITINIDFLMVAVLGVVIGYFISNKKLIKSK